MQGVFKVSVFLYVCLNQPRMVKSRDDLTNLPDPGFTDPPLIQWLCIASEIAAS